MESWPNREVSITKHRCTAPPSPIAIPREVENKKKMECVCLGKWQCILYSIMEANMHMQIQGQGWIHSSVKRTAYMKVEEGSEVSVWNAQNKVENRSNTSFLCLSKVERSRECLGVRLHIFLSIPYHIPHLVFIPIPNSNDWQYIIHTLPPIISPFLICLFSKHALLKRMENIFPFCLSSFNHPASRNAEDITPSTSDYLHFSPPTPY